MKHQRISEFAEAVGVSHTAIRKAIDSGRIPSEFIASRESRTGRAITVITNPPAARAAYLGSEVSSPPNDSRAAVGDSVPDISRSRAVSEAYKAKMAQLEFEERASKLVDAELLRAKISAQIVAARTRLLGVPSKAKSRIPHLSVEDVGTLEKLIREALEDVAGTASDRMCAFLDSTRAQWMPAVLDEPPSTITEEMP
jgi:phage terminase Nu1 subunit (DNA packaging protein)